MLDNKGGDSTRYIEPLLSTISLSLIKILTNHQHAATSVWICRCAKICSRKLSMLLAQHLSNVFCCPNSDVTPLTFKRLSRVCSRLQGRYRLSSQLWTICRV